MVQQLTSFVAMVDAALAIEKLRVASEVRQTHLFLNGLKALEAERIITAEQVVMYKRNWEKDRSVEGIPQEYRLHDTETDELVRRQKDLEDFVDGRVAYLIQGHPAYYWFSRVLGVGKENIGKVVGPINIERAKTPSALWKFAGFAVEYVCVNCGARWGRESEITPCCGHQQIKEVAPKRVKGGGKLSYNSQLRSMCWRLGGSLRRAGLRLKCKKCGNLFGSTRTKCPKCNSEEYEQVAVSKFAQYYLKEKVKSTERFLNQGYKILPTPQGKWVCLNCGESWAKKSNITPCCNSPIIEKKVREEPVGVIWKGHLDAMAVRKMIKLFLVCLWVVWREAEGLPITKPYAIDVLKHNSYIDPWEMVDRKARVGE